MTFPRPLATILPLLILLLTCFRGQAQTQNWKPAMEGILDGGIHQGFVLDIQFKPNGPLGRDWIYGRWLDQDSILRYAAYREGGRWVPLPITGSFNGGKAHDIAQYGDTMYLGGVFTTPIFNGDSVPLRWVSIIKYWNDSLWHSLGDIEAVYDFAVSGDSLLAWIYPRYNPPLTLSSHSLSTDGGTTWQNPYSVPQPNPNGPWSGFGVNTHFEIRHGDIYTLNDGAQGPYSGVTRWDGQQWHSHGDGVYGTWSKAYDFDFYKGELYMAGSFSKTEDPLNPGQFIARWDGAKWNEVGGGLTTGVFDLFTTDNALYCQIVGKQFGDAHITSLAAWDGHQWCGTPIQYKGNAPLNYGVIKDTLYGVCKFLPGTANGQPMSYLNYFDGDYLHGPNAVCSSRSLGEEAVAVENLLQVYPNPVRDIFSISLPGETSNGTYILYSLKGQRLLSGELKAPESKIILPKSLRGMYLLEVSWEGNSIRKKLVVE